MSDDVAEIAVKPRKKRGVVLPLILFIVAAVAFGAVFVVYDGAKLVGDWYAQAVAALSGPAGGPVTPPAGGEATSTATATIDPDLAARMYVEQVESEANLERLARGEFVSFDITSVDTTGGTAVIGLRASLMDGSSGQGAMVVVEDHDAWFLFSLSGMRDESTGGLADTIAGSASMEASETLAVEMAQVGIKSVDQDVVATMVTQQRANQKLVKGVLDGTYVKLSMGKPVEGAGTITVPVTLIGRSGDTTAGQIVMVRKSIEGKQRIFATTFSVK